VHRGQQLFVMLNRSTHSNHDNPLPWGVVSPRRAQTTILDGIVTKVHHHNSQTINDSSKSIVFNAPVNGYVHTAKNGGAVNVHVQNVSRQVGVLRGHGNNEIHSPITTPDRTIIRKDGTQVMRGGKESDNVVGRSVTVAVGGSSSAPTVPDLELEQELQGLSPGMQAFCKALQRDARERERRDAEPVKKRNRTM